MAKMKLGTIVGISDDPPASFARVAELELPTCQVAVGAEQIKTMDPKAVRKAADGAGVEISSVFLGFDGQVYDLKDGPATMGLVAPKLRDARLPSALNFCDLVADMGISSITCHIGFIPDDESDPIYPGFIDIMQQVGRRCADHNQIFCFETGQELASTLLRTIEDIGIGNMFINLDPANLILYGKSNPLDAVEIFGELVRGMHAKDGVWPNRDEFLGLETAIGEGDVRFDLLLPRLKAKGFAGPVTIEREISGPQQAKDIKKSMEQLDPFL
jgi:sugar phosphate isomerase/epimerase